jgi:hypothetical protein
MTSDRKQPAVAFWATVVVAVLVLYPLSFGPACWINQRWHTDRRILSAIYRPVLSLASERGYLPELLHWYAAVGARNTDLPVVREGTLWWISEWDLAIASRTEIHLGPFSRAEIAARERALEYPLVHWVDHAGKQVWIGLGAADDEMAPGTTGVVRSQSRTEGDSDDSEPEPDATVKAKVEVIGVTMPGILVARIITEDEHNPIAKRDRVSFAPAPRP